LCVTYPSAQVSKFERISQKSLLTLIVVVDLNLTISTEVVEVVYQKFVGTAADCAMDAKTVCGFIST